MGAIFFRLIVFLIPVLCLFQSEIAFSMPNYARQSSVTCFTCHSQPVDALTLAGASEEAGNNLYSSTAAGIQIELKTRTAGSEAANAGGISAKPVTELYLTKDDDFDRGLSGLSGYLSGGGFYAGLSLLSPSQKMTNLNGQAAPLSLWYRFGVAPKVGGVNLAIGVFGETVSPSGIPSISASTEYDGTDTIGLDAKINGQIGGVSLDLKAMYLNSISSQASTVNSRYGRSQEPTYAKERSEGFGAAARLNIEKAFGLTAAYRTYKSKNVDDPTQTNLATIGAWVSLPYDIMLESQYTTTGENSDFLTEQSAFTLLFITSF